MKIYNLFFIGLVVVLFFVASCTRNQKNEGLEFKQMCQNAGYEWMLMKPTKNGKFTKDAEACWGCMVDGIEHVCSKEELMEYVPK